MANIFRPLQTPIFVLLLSGCANIPDLGSLTQLRTPDLFSSEKSFTAPITEWPSDEWWTAYNDPQLTNLINEGLQSSPTMADAAARLARAQAVVEQNRGYTLPTIVANGNLSEIKQSYNNGVPADFVPQGFQESARTTLDFSYELDFWGRNRKALAASISDVNAAALDARQARLTLSSGIAADYAELSRLYADLDEANDALNVRNRTTDLLKKRLDNGLENEGSFEQSRAVQATAATEIDALNEQIALTKNHITALMGVGPDRALDIKKPKIAKLKAFGLPANLPVALLGRRPDLMAAKLRATSAEERIGVARAAFYPNIDLMAYAGRQSLGIDMFAKGGSFIGSFGPAITLPIFDAGQISGNYRKSYADYDLAVATYNATLNQALHDVADVAISQRALKPRLEKSRRATAAAERAYNIVNKRYKGGLATYLDVLQAENTLIGNRRALIDLSARALTLDVAMAKALGGGFDINFMTQKDASHDAK